MTQTDMFPDQATPAPEATPECEACQPIELALLGELRRQRDAFDAAQAEVASQRRSERRWQGVFQLLVLGLPTVCGLAYFLFFMSSAGVKWGPFSDAVGIVRIEGTIGTGERAAADAVIPKLERAFADDNVKAVALAIDSGGGAPVEAERIAASIDSLKKQHPKPVVAVVGNMGASAAYLIAVHADKIIVGRYSVVGSIGAIIRPWQLERAAERLGASQQVYASGPLKSFLDPFSPISEAASAKAQSLVDQLGTEFQGEVKARRGRRLKEGVDYGTGELWTGREAVELGLADSIGTLDEYVRATWSVKPYDFGPSPDGLRLFAKALQEVVASSARSLSELPLTIR